MIEFKPTEKSNYFYLFHNGEKVEGISVRIDKDSASLETHKPILGAETRETGERLISLIDSEPDFPEYERLAIHNWNNSGDIKFQDIYKEFKDDYFTWIVAMKDFDIEESEIDSLNFIVGLKNREFDIYSSGYEKDDKGDFFIKLEFEVGKEQKVSFLESLVSSEAKIRKFCELTKIKFLENHKPNILSVFNFPAEIKISCEQYLLYFAQFLQDLGINATSNLKEEAGKVLFSVTPTDDVEALDKIREALAVYLNLPASPIVYDDSFAAMRLQQQIENLQHSQRMAVRELQFNEKLLIAQSDMIREKNITISQQQSVIEQQDKIIEKISSKSIMMDSAENKEELEEIYDGLEAGHSKWLYELTGIKANFIKMISTSVKNTFPKDEKKSVLGLNEED